MRKLALNFTCRALAVLGFKQYARFWLTLLRGLPSVIRTRKLGHVDQLMGSVPIVVNYRSKRFSVDCPYCDARTRSIDDSGAFGLVRELFIRSCYLHDSRDSSALASLEYVVDCGANRGLFSVFAATFAKQVIAVEAQPIFAELIHRNMTLNGLTNYTIDHSFVGMGGALKRSGVSPSRPTVTISDLIRTHGLSRIDLLKLDIEGSEFSLFAEPSWLDCVRNITMEIHREEGDPARILASLRRYGFKYDLWDEELRPVDRAGAAAFLYATGRT